eukprot:6324294-Amphidinium_carterae.1
MQIRFIVANVQSALLALPDIDDNNVTVHTGEKPHIEKNGLDPAWLKNCILMEHICMLLQWFYLGFTNPLRSSSTRQSIRDTERTTLDTVGLRVYSLKRANQ